MAQYNPYDAKNRYEREINELKAVIKSKETEIADLKKAHSEMSRVMCNRCHALSMGALCMWCGYKDSCEHYQR